MSTKKKDMELRGAISKLNDYLAMNLEISNDNKQKDATISRKISELNALKQSNNAILVQQQIQYTLIDEDIQFKCDTIKKEVDALNLQLNRLSDMETENIFLLDATKNLENDIKQQVLTNDDIIRNLKTESKYVNDDVAATYINELNRIRVECQKEVYAKDLTDSEREVIVMNSKLKDEVGFQIIGMENLSERLVRQNVETNRLYSEIKQNQRKDVDTHAQLGSLRMKRQRLKDETMYVNL